jgi:quercetin dioxygenase-like cupin family protein
MTAPYTFLADLADPAPPATGIYSRTVFADDRLKAVVFGFAAGEELSDHTAAVPAVIHVVKGEATLTLGDDSRPAGPGTWVHMPAGLRHAVRAETPLVMLLLMLKAPAAAAGG